MAAALGKKWAAWWEGSDKSGDLIRAQLQWCGIDLSSLSPIVSAHVLDESDEILLHRSHSLSGHPSIRVAQARRY